MKSGKRVSRRSESLALKRAKSVFRGTHSTLRCRGNQSDFQLSRTKIVLVGYVSLRERYERYTMVSCRITSGYSPRMIRRL